MYLPTTHTQIAEAVELVKFEETRRRALEQKAVQTQQLEELKVREGWSQAAGIRLLLGAQHSRVNDGE